MAEDRERVKGGETTVEYDLLGRIIAITDPMGAATAYSYDANGNLLSVTDALRHATKYTYDKDGNLTSETDALGNRVQYAYTPEGWLSSVTKADGAVMTFEYDKTGALTRQNVGDGQSVTSSYNEIGKLTEVSSEAGTIRYQYNEQGFLISVENVNGDVVSYTYDAYGNKTSMTYPDGRTVSYTYDAMNRMVGVVGLDGETTSYVYDAVGRRIQTVSGNMTTRYAYDSVGNLTEQATSGASDIAFRYSYDRNGYITGEKRTENGTETENSYAYSALGELTSFLQSTGYGESYAYDKAGNMLEKAITGTDGQNVTLKMAYNAANQLTGMTNGQSKLAYSYDKNGSLIQKTLTSKTYGKLTDRYAYDALDQLTSYVGYDGYQQQFTYDANGMRLSKKETGDESRSTLEELLRGNIAGLPEIVEPAQSQTNANGADAPTELEWATTEYLYDLTQEYYQVISETTTSASGTSATTAYAYGLERIAAYNENGVTRYVYDGRGSVAQTVNAPVAGAAVSSALPDISVKVQSFAYTAFGEQMGGVKVSGFTYNAEAYDAATGMLNLRARQYEPALNRFSQKDIYPPNLLITYSFNAYLFTFNSPISFVDADGLQASSLRNVLSSIGNTVKKVVGVVGSGIKKVVTAIVGEKVVNTFVSGVKSAAKTVAHVVQNVAIAAASWTSNDPKTIEIIKAAQEEINALDQSDPEYVKKATAIFIAACELAASQVKEQAARQKEHEEFMLDMYGFEKEEVRIMDKIRVGLKAFDPGLTDDEIDWVYTRAIGRLVYGDSNDSFKEWADMMMWDGTVTTELIPEEQLFTKVIGLSQQEYKLLRYKVRVQNQILGAVETMSYTALLNYPKTLAQYKASMEIALGKQLSDLEFERLWTDQYNAMSTASDYAHYNITKAAIFATDYPPFTFDVIEWIKRKLANQQTGGSDSTREDMAGWLGDATIRTNNGKVAFSPDDYMADLDADNVMNIMKTQNISHSEAEAIYFKRLENGETRAEVFLSHTSLDFVISEVLSRLNINSLEELKTIEPEAYAFIVSLEHGSNELEVVP